MQAAPVAGGRSIGALTGLIYLFFGAQAVIATATGALMPGIIATFHMSLAQVGLMGSLTAVGALAANLAGALLADRLGKQHVLWVSVALAGLGTAGAALTATLNPFLAMALLRGAGGGLSNLVGNALIADLHWGRRGLYLGLLHSLFGAGALLGPLLSAAYVGTGGTWVGLFAAVGAVQLLVGLLLVGTVARVPKALFQAPAIPAAASGAAAAPYRVLIPLCLGMATYTISQTVLITWLPTFLHVEAGWPAALAGSSLSVFWLGMVGGRLATIWLADHQEGRTVLFTMSAAGTVFTALTALAPSHAILFGAAFLAGLCTGGIWPQSLAYVYGAVPAASGRVTGAITVSTGISGIVLAALTGVVAQHTSLRGAMLTDLAYIAATAAAFAFLPRYHPRENQARAARATAESGAGA